ncbi:glycosyltransferase [Runella sp. CRIBMP]|uniref:glycosyltransferase n=1 Tax=Runella sp. CRIBMP TaxID=2683261 RepID=UPI001411DD12|nr:glycosyltransferase [Runella sp. CRIBMP]NBB22947.1 glycosyltransferase [Runella sp. CRIBMP]
MKILSLSHSDVNGGAARAAYRIFEALNESGVDIKMLVKHKGSSNNNVLEISEFSKNIIADKIDIWKTKIENKYYKNKLKNYNLNGDTFISNLSSISLKKALSSIDFDIIHLHWVSHQFLNVHDLININTPIVWTLHDCFPFTGICHYFDKCDKYTKSCGSCPVLNSNNEKDLSRDIWNKKAKLYKKLNINVVTPSKWLGNCASQSSLFCRFPVSVIPYPIDIEIFKPTNKNPARISLGLNANKKYVLFGAMNALVDSRKGFHYFKSAFEYFSSTDTDNTEILILGSQENDYDSINGYKVRFMGHVDDEIKLINLLNAADVVVVPSISENLSLVIMESLSCGIPVVAFDIGGNADMIDHKSNGYLASPYSVEDLSNGIYWCLEHTISNQLSDYSRKKVVDNFSKNTIANKYQTLYNSL